MSSATAELEWGAFLEEGAKRFGANREDWRFQCPACGHVQSIGDFMKRHPDAKRPEVAAWIFFNCEGRYDRSVGCNWSLGGLLHIHERTLTKTGTEADNCPVFLFDGETPSATPFYTPREKQATRDHPHDR